MIQEANNNNNCNIFQFNIDGDVDLNEFAKNFENIMLKKTNFLHTKFSEVQNEKLNKIYNCIAPIVNSFDSNFYISDKDKNELEKSIAQMELFEDSFEDETEEGKIFYNNFFATLLKVDKDKFILKYESSPKYIKKGNNKYLYSCILYECNRKQEAYENIDNLIITENNETYFIQKCFFLMLDKDAKLLKKLIGKSKKNDEKGCYGVFELYINSVENLNFKAIKKLNKKYKNKPLFHMYYAKLLFENNDKNIVEIRNNIKCAYNSIKKDDLGLLLELLNLSSYVKQDDYILKLCGQEMFNSDIINSKILNILINKTNKSDKDIENIKQKLSSLKNKDLVDVEVVNAIISLSLNKDLEAINHFKNSYLKCKNRYVASNLLNLILKNNDERNFDIISELIDILKKSNNGADQMLISSAYLALGDNEKALESAFLGVVMSPNQKEYFMRLWAISIKSEIKPTKISIIGNDCVVELLNEKKKLIILFDSNLTSTSNSNFFQGVKINHDKNLETKLFGKIVGDTIQYEKKCYKINAIVNKYDYFLPKIFSLLEKDKYFKTLRTNDTKEPFGEIKEALLEHKKNTDYHFKMYDLETTDLIGLPLSTFVNNEDKTYQNIMMNLLFGNKNMKLYAGEINFLQNDSKIIIDITSLVMLNQYNLLDKLIQHKENIFITQSTINTVNKTFKYYLKNHKQSLSISIGDDGNLYKQELTEEDYKLILEFWRKIYEISKSFNIVNHESVLEKSNLEGCQIDAVDYSIKTGYVLISEDLLIKKLAYSMNNKIINSSNFISLIDNICLTDDEYINIILSLSRGNYIYCVNEVTLRDMIIFSNNNIETQNKVLEIIKNLISTNFIYDVYLKIIMRTILYIYYYFENINDVYFKVILDLILEKSIEYKNNNCANFISKIKKEMKFI